MDIAFELIKDLWSSLTLSAFMKALAIIAFLTYILVNFFLKNKKEGGFITLFQGAPKENIEMKDIKDKLASFVINHTESMAKLLSAVQMISSEASNNVRTQAEDYNNLRKDIDESKSDMISELDDVKHWFKMHDQNVTQSAQSLKDLLQRVLDLLAKMNSQLEKIDEFARQIAPETREDNREINRGITELSKDIALIERTIQTQVSSKSIKLR